MNTDRRDAVPLARLLRSGALTRVHGPTADDAAIRALARARQEALHALKTAKCRLTALLRRHDSRDTGRATWSPAHGRGLAEVGCATPARQRACQEDGRAVNEHADRLQRLEPDLCEQVNAWRLAPVVEALHARRGVPFTVAVTLAAELGDLRRLEKPRQGMNYLGLLPAA